MRYAMILALMIAAIATPASAAHRHRQTNPMVTLLAIGLSQMLIASQHGIASQYGGERHHNLCGGPTASGERHNCSAMTAAHKSLPFGTRVNVINKTNGRSVTVRIYDRGPFVRGRVIDLSPAAAHALGCGGTCPVALSW